MAQAQRTRLALAATLLAVVFFALGLLAAGRLNPPFTPPPQPAAAASAPSAGDAGAAASPALFPEPRIALDPDRVELLPDASLRIELPSGFGGGGGSAQGAGAR